MKRIKLVSMILLAFVLVFVTACGGNNASTPGSNQPAGDPVTTTPQQPADTPEEPEEPAVDLGGRVIRLAAWWDDTPTPDSADGMYRIEQEEKVKAKYNVEIEYVNIPFEEYMDNFTTSVLAGDPMADMLVLEYKRAIVPVQDGMLIPLSEVTTGISDVNNEQRLVTKLPQLGGEEYAVAKGSLTSVVGIHYNRELFRDLGLQDPQELFLNNQWTWETFLEIARNATRDVDNDGVNDYWGTSGWPADMIRHFAATNDVAFVDPNEFFESFTDPRMIEVMEFVQSIVNVEGVHKVKSGNKTDWNETRTWKDGDVAMAIMYDWDLGDVTFDYGVVPIPQGPSGTGKYSFADTALNGWFIPKGVENPDIVYQIFEELQDIPMIEEYPGQNWLEGRYWTEADIQIAREHIMGRGMVSIEEGIPDFPFYGIVHQVIEENKSVAATVEENKQVADTALEKLRQ